tara:strand:- start:143 stop:865 length:723 start_codon:yes stop_codon:yes gene_type:complete
MTREVVAQLCDHQSLPAEAPTLGAIVSFYMPLALTSVITMAAQPTVTFFMGQSRFPLESLAVLPVVHGLTFIFRALGLSFQEVGIALMGNGEHYRQLRNFARGLALAAVGGLSLMVYTPMATIWFQQISGLSPELTGFALLPARILALFPAGSVWISFQRALLVHGRETTAITRASIVEVGVVVLVLSITVFTFSWVGATAAATAILVGRIFGNLSLVAPARRMVGRLTASRLTAAGTPS